MTSESGYLRTREEIVLREYPVPTIQHLLAELSLIKDDVNLIQTIDIESAAKLSRTSPFTFVKQLELDMLERRVKLMTSN